MADSNPKMGAVPASAFLTKASAPTAYDPWQDQQVWVADWEVHFNNSDFGTETVTAGWLTVPRSGQDGWGQPEGFQLWDWRVGTGEHYVVAHIDPHSVRAIIATNWRQELR